MVLPAFSVAAVWETPGAVTPPGSLVTALEASLEAPAPSPGVHVIELAVLAIEPSFWIPPTCCNALVVAGTALEPV